MSKHNQAHPGCLELHIEDYICSAGCQASITRGGIYSTLYFFQLSTGGCSAVTGTDKWMWQDRL